MATLPNERPRRRPDAGVLLLAAGLLLATELGGGTAHAQYVPPGYGPVTPTRPSASVPPTRPAQEQAAAQWRAFELTPPRPASVPAPPLTGRYPATPHHSTIDHFDLPPPEPQLRLPGHVHTRLRVLGQDLDELAARGGSGVADGVLSIVTGGLSITLGVFLEENNSILSSYLYLLGAANVTRGIIDLAVTPDPYTPALEYSHMPMRTVDEVKTRLRFGEEALEDLASRSRLARILDATVSTLAGVLFVPVYLARRDTGSGGDDIDTLGAFVMIGAGISVISGLISLTTSSEAERRWNVYSELKKRLAAERLRKQRGGLPAARVSELLRLRQPRGLNLRPKTMLALAPNGGFLALRWGF